MVAAWTADYSYLKDSLAEGLVGHTDIDMALMRVLKQRFKLGMFDPPEQQPWSNISLDVVGSQRHQELAIEAVRKGGFLLRLKLTCTMSGRWQQTAIEAVRKGVLLLVEAGQ